MYFTSSYIVQKFVLNVQPCFIPPLYTPILGAVFRGKRIRTNRQPVAMQGFSDLSLLYRMGIAALLSSYRSAAATSRPSKAIQATHRPGWSQTSMPIPTPRIAAIWPKRWSRTSFKAASKLCLKPKRQWQKMIQHRRCVCSKKTLPWRNLLLPLWDKRQIAETGLLEKVLEIPTGQLSQKNYTVQFLLQNKRKVPKSFDFRTYSGAAIQI